MRRLDTCFCNAVASLRPAGIYYAAKPSVIRFRGSWMAGYCDLLRYEKGLVSQKQIRGFRKVLSIEKGYYDYEYFNICFLNNVLSLCLKAVSEGYLPQVNIMNSKGLNIWEMFFEQPFPEISRAGKKVISFSERNFEAFPQWKDVYDSRMVRLYGNLYRDFVTLRPEAKAYIRNEMDHILGKGKILGVLCRGTDYTRSKPKGHPVQPEPEEILEKAGELFAEKKYEYIYLATEDSQYDTLFRERFRNRLLINQRQYYDAKFDEKDLQLIKDVHFDRDNDDYLKGLEYLSSLFILAGCNGLAAGNCGGTEAAVFWNLGKYEDKVIFDLGEY